MFASQKCDGIVRPRLGGRGFNGAGMFPSQKSCVQYTVLCPAMASMGPGCFHPRNGAPVGGTPVTIQRFNGAGMFPSQKCGRAVCNDHHVPASMGPGCFHPRNQGHLGIAQNTYELQWGRDVSIPEMVALDFPLSFTGQLQWGRDVSIPEIPRYAPSDMRMPRFNGAGMFPSQKYRAPQRTKMTPDRFNGAGMFP